MPLTLERDGLFRGRRDSADAWYIVDPEVEGGVEPIVASWRQQYATTNRARWQRIPRIAVFLLVWLAVIGVGALLAFVLIPGVERWSGYIMVVAALLGAALAGRAWALMRPAKTVPSFGHPAIVSIPIEIERWADDERPVSEIWALVRAWQRLEEVRILLSLVSEAWWEDLGHRRPDDSIEALLEPTIREQWDLRRQGFSEVAAAVSFTPPAGMLDDLPRLSEFRER